MIDWKHISTLSGHSRSANSWFTAKTHGCWVFSGSLHALNRMEINNRSSIQFNESSTKSWPIRDTRYGLLKTVFFYCYALINKLLLIQLLNKGTFTWRPIAVRRQYTGRPKTVRISDVHLLRYPICLRSPSAVWYPSEMAWNQYPSIIKCKPQFPF